MLQKLENHIAQNFSFLNGKRLLLATSGGLDSMVMVDLFKKLAFDFAIAHCNFQLRGLESFGDQNFVQNYADTNEINLFLTQFDTEAFAKDYKLSTQVAARELRYSWFYELLENEKFDTLLLLMNGTGIFGTLRETPKFLQKLKSLLNPNGQILIDSSDIIYMFDDDEDGGKRIPSNGYYGELTFTIRYKNEKEDQFPWLYLDYNTLQNAAFANGLQSELILEGEHYDYLAKLSL